ncbi:MAG TPA: AbrB/MazE/SpoVT family DNA-binding domain-containing protein [Calditrichia bacterium]|nr:AbrB/MazE/SpoVT family DNA-binding domain-containing protein [Calditrichota bacterium]HQU73192.1 AbrB/MazE/SpoVT family DNA-binding domain-containing protein [Calditrichia bacterium]HQV31590.1 AbrB/MazE/SpoVT family DNA-binding domain-containing protein [Calditrichia bacterium]
MQTRIVRIGNSQGIRIPKLIIEQLGKPDAVELEIKNNQLIISPITTPRSGWGEAFERMAADGDEQSPEISFPQIDDPWQETEWTW